MNFRFRAHNLYLRAHFFFVYPIKVTETAYLLNGPFSSMLFAQIEKLRHLLASQLDSNIQLVFASHDSFVIVQYVFI